MDRQRNIDKLSKRFLKPSLNRPDVMMPPGKQQTENAAKPENKAPVKSRESVDKGFTLIENGTDLLRGMILAEVLGKPRCRRRR